MTFLIPCTLVLFFLCGDSGTSYFMMPSEQRRLQMEKRRTPLRRKRRLSKYARTDSLTDDFLVFSSNRPRPFTQYDSAAMSTMVSSSNHHHGRGAPPQLPQLSPTRICVSNRPRTASRNAASCGAANTVLVIIVVHLQR